MVLTALASRKGRNNALLRKKRLARAQKKRKFAQRQAQELCSDDHVCFQLLFTYKNPVDKRKSFTGGIILSVELSPRDWHDKFRMSQATFVDVYDELRFRH